MQFQRYQAEPLTPAAGQAPPLAPPFCPAPPAGSPPFCPARLVTVVNPVPVISDDAPVRPKLPDQVVLAPATVIVKVLR
jgi:hypothetical protein